MSERQSIGREGEARAVAYLQQRGATILERNWRIGHYEVDIIAQQGEVLLFVEVKSRYEGEEEAILGEVKPQQKQRLINAAEKYLQKYCMDIEIRFDVAVWIGGEGREGKLGYFENVFSSLDFP